MRINQLVKEEGWKYFRRFVFVVLRYNTNIMNKLIFNHFLKLKTKKYSWAIQIFVESKNHPTFHSEERLFNLESGRECFVGLSSLLISYFSGGCVLQGAEGAGCDGRAERGPRLHGGLGLCEDGTSLLPGSRHG